ncbi:hypothetical protein ACPOL_2143 [Acidisarcina polymorpha]|uniref:Uncharacterized protein n=1 Tax=Acidisarcina polymorpha TaxID=2211140 RepID=A0A2Z5FYC4_9BACT|nr:hypothetical protein ACPOL_2143 [Acidisarcina polymorpha]
MVASIGPMSFFGFRDRLGVGRNLGARPNLVDRCLVCALYSASQASTTTSCILLGKGIQRVLISWGTSVENSKPPFGARKGRCLKGRRYGKAISRD